MTIEEQRGRCGHSRSEPKTPAHSERESASRAGPEDLTLAANRQSTALGHLTSRDPVATISTTAHLLFAHRALLAALQR